MITTPPVISSVIASLGYLWQLINGFRASHEKGIALMRETDLSPYCSQRSSLRILDVANGRLRPQYYILREAGYSVFGIDVVNKCSPSWQEYAYRVARWLYKRSILQRDLVKDDNLVCGDVCDLPYKDRSIDIVVSAAAFEHFLDVPKVVKELYRITNSGGLIWVLVHLFTSPSGGHNVNLHQVPLRDIPWGNDPWDHLRKRRLPFHVPLNEWRKDQYLAEFQKRFEIIHHYCAMREGEHLLSPEIEEELSCYSRDELTCGSYVIVARKRF